MWLDCFDVFVNIDKLEFITFEEDGVANLYFTGRAEPLQCFAPDIEELKTFFYFKLGMHETETSA